MSEISVASLLALGLFIGILILLEVGRRIGEWRLGRDPDGARADLNATFIQPFVTDTTATAWTFTLQTESAYDWEGEQWNVPIAALVAKLTKIGGQLVQFQGGPRYYAASTDSGPEGWALRFNVVLLFPR